MNLSPSTFATPISQEERITILDSLRGIAILGILLMNVPGFGLPEAQASNPALYNETGINYKTWFVVNWAFSGTQRAFFSMLFGAGIILFISRLEKRMTGIEPALYFFRRQMWLLAFGLFNAFVLLWFGDILYTYAIYGLFVFVFYRASPKKLLILASVCLLLMLARNNVDHFRNKNIVAKGEMAAAIDTTTTKLTVQQKEAIEALNGLKEKSSFEAKRKSAEKEIRAITGNYASLYAAQSDKSVYAEFYYTYFYIWDVLLMMFLGMAFFKTGVLIGKAPYRLYWIFFIGGTAIGLLLSWLFLQSRISNHFNAYEIAKNVPIQYYELERLCRTLGFFGLIMLMYKSGFFKWFFALFRPVGQMAFTNYLMQSFISMIFFYGIGFGYFGKLERYELYIYTGIVWLVEIIWSHIWLRYFTMGPLEWIWRMLTYGKKLSILKNRP
ncbi:MAG TPA: DUF418 domain-containing protein [Chitinophagaceae bacterium]|nr:DUF418 domain-containing protein [Chitinophagaceae bacterium]